MIRVLLTKTALLGATVMTVAAAHAQIRDFDATGTGRGTWDFGRYTKNPQIDEVKVTLRPDHHAIIRLTRGATEVLEGRWSNENDQRVNIKVEKLGRTAATGSGTIDHDRNGHLLFMHFTGMSDRESFNLDFTTRDQDQYGRRADNSNRGNTRSFSDTQSGRGNLSFGDLSGDARIRRISVDLKDDGTAEIRLLAGSTDRFYGRWRNRDENSARITIDRMGRDDATGGGTVTWNSSRDLASITLMGNARDHRFNLSFTTSPAKSTGNYDGRDRGRGYDDLARWSEEERTFIRNARHAIEDKFNAGSPFEWSREAIGGNTFGTRSVTGEFRLSGRDGGTYEYKVVLGAGTAEPISVSYHRI